MPATFLGDTVFSLPEFFISLILFFGVELQLASAMKTSLPFLPRIIVAVVLVLSLLSGVVPFSSASVGHLCTMECCAGLAPHAAGSCHMNMSAPGKVAAEATERGSDQLCKLPQADNGATKGITAGVMGMKASTDSSLDLDDVTIDASDHCSTDAQSKAASGVSHNDYPQPASIATQSFSKPCPPECGTGALSSGVRPSRHAVALAYNARPRPPTPGRKRQHSSSNDLITSTYCKQLRPRGPPLAFS